MRHTVRFVTGVAVLSAVGLAGAPAAFASEVACSTYANRCVTTGTVGDRTVVRGGGAATTANTLPFTGGEAVMVGLVGAGALAAGVVLVAATRRRAVPA